MNVRWIFGHRVWRRRFRNVSGRRAVHRQEMAIDRAELQQRSAMAFEARAEIARRHAERGLPPPY